MAKKDECTTLTLCLNDEINRYVNLFHAYHKNRGSRMNKEKAAIRMLKEYGEDMGLKDFELKRVK